MSTALAAVPATRRGLSPDEIAHWREHGWVAVPGFFGAGATAALQAAVAELQGRGLLRNVATAGDGVTRSTSRRNLQLCPCGPHHRLLRALPWHAPVVAAIEGLFDAPAVQELDQIFLKPAGDGAGTGWHTDNAYFHCKLTAAGTGMWIAVHDANRANGCMRILDRSHLREWRHVRDGGSDHHITCAAEVHEAEAIPIELAAGGVLFFNYGIAHATGANATTRDRAGLAYHFRRRDAVEVGRKGNGHYLKDGGLLQLSGAACDGGRARHGEDMRGVFEGMAGA